MLIIGDAVIHPSYGAGTVVEIKERRSLGSDKRYYSIALLGQQGTVVMVPVGAEKRVGLRRPMSKSKLGQVWRILQEEPDPLPSKHEERYRLIKSKLHGGDVLQVAEALRDMAWRREEKHQLTLEGKRLYDHGLEILAGEVATSQGSDLETAEMQIYHRLTESLESGAM
jgi:RNA polymerase-interacting CarD/CdnL/TRCF family regulator